VSKFIVRWSPWVALFLGITAGRAFEGFWAWLFGGLVSLGAWGGLMFIAFLFAPREKWEERKEPEPEPDSVVEKMVSDGIDREHAEKLAAEMRKAVQKFIEEEAKKRREGT
jgi:hypothetical protein